MSKRETVTVVILNFNGVSDTSECLKSLLKTEYKNFNILVVDNGSAKDEAAKIRRRFFDDRVKFLRFKINYGYAEGNNKALEGVKSKYVVFLNNDTVVDKSWLRELVKVMESDEKITVCVPKFRSYYKREYFDPSAAGGKIDSLGFAYSRGRIVSSIEKDVGQYDKTSDLFWGSGTCLLVKRNRFEEVGRFPGEFFFYHEETDLCWRLRDAGYRVVYCHKAIVYHKVASTSIRNLSRRIYYVHRNNLLLLVRNLSFSRLLWVLPLRMIFEFVAGFYYLSKGSFSHFLSLVQAEIDFFMMLPGQIARRINENKSRKYFVEREMKPLSIIWDYYIKGLKRYPEILGRESQSMIIGYDEIVRSLDERK